MRRALLFAVAAAALVVVLVIGLGQAGGGGSEPRADGPAFDLEAARKDLAGAPEPLASLHRDANRLIPSDLAGFEARLASLRGTPVVINKWASWCGPCRAEFPFFQRQGVARGREVAFLGLNSDDSEGEARTFLRDAPLPFPSYRDADSAIADEYARASFPTTVFIDEQGKTAFVHQGQYRTEQDLADDIDRYLAR